MKIRKESIVDVVVNMNNYYNIKILKILKHRIVGLYRDMICDFQRQDIRRVVTY